MKVTHEDSMKEHERLLTTPPSTCDVPIKSVRKDLFSSQGKSVVAIVHSNTRREGIREALHLLGGLNRMCREVKGEVIIKPNCNLDDPFPRNSHPEIIRIIAESLIASGINPEQIVVGDMSGRYRGLPTRYTIENMGLATITNDLNIRLSYFDEEDWVIMKHSPLKSWPHGIKIPRRVYDADRIIFTPVIRPHINAIFTSAMKLSVGLIDAVDRELAS